MIDYALILGYWFFSIWLIVKIFDGIDSLESFSIPAYIFILAPVAFYIPVSEYFWSGRTVGKYLLKLRVMKNDGSAASLGDIILRWLLRPIDIKLGFILFFFASDNPSSEFEEGFNSLIYVLWYIPFPLVGIISMLVTKNNQRVGDLVANTVVVFNKRLFSLDDTILQSTEADYEPVFTNVLTLGDKDIYIIKNVLDNSEKSKDHKALTDLAAKAREILKIEQEMPPRQLLQTLLNDYNYLAKKKDEVL